MSAFYVTLGVCAPDRSQAKMLRLKANTGAEYSRLSGNLLRGLGWEPDPHVLPWGWPLSLVYQTGLQVGDVKLRIAGKDYLHSVIFGADDCEPALGSWSARGLLLKRTKTDSPLSRDR